MKKILTSIFALALVICTAFGFSACASKGTSGDYKVHSVSIMGLTASQKDFQKYSRHRSEEDKEYNALYKPLALIMDLRITIKDNKAIITIYNFKKTLSNDSHYVQVLAYAEEYKFINEKGDLYIDSTVVEKDETQADVYFIWLVDENGNKQDLTNIFGATTPFADQCIHATIKNGQLACNLKLTVQEPEGAPSQAILTTTATIRMKR